MLRKLKTLFELKTNPDLVENTKCETATLDIDLQKLITVDYPMLRFTPELKFQIGSETKKVTGKSSHNERGEHTHRFYTEDDYFFQFNFFGENKIDNLTDIMLFKYQLDAGDEFCSKSDKATENYWRNIIEESEIFSFEGAEYHRLTGVLGGLEVVEVIGDDLNTIDNTFAVFSRDITPQTQELVIVNVEQEVVVNDNNDIVHRGNYICSIALGVSIPFTQLTINHHQG